MKALLLAFLLFFTAQNSTVLICTGSRATKYHAQECKGLSKCTRTIEKISITEARKRGFTPCGYCY